MNRTYISSEDNAAWSARMKATLRGQRCTDHGTFHIRTTLRLCGFVPRYETREWSADLRRFVALAWIQIDTRLGNADDFSGVSERGVALSRGHRGFGRHSDINCAWHEMATPGNPTEPSARIRLRQRDLVGTVRRRRRCVRRSAPSRSPSIGIGLRLARNQRILHVEVSK